MPSFDSFQVLYANGAPAAPIRLGQLLVDESEPNPLDMLKVCTDLSPVTYESIAGGGLPADGDYGDISVSGAGTVWTIDAGAVTLAKMENRATQTFIGRTTAGTGVPEELTATQATAILNSFTTSLKGLAPASGGGTTNFLRADGTWNAPVGTANLSYTASTRLLASSSGTDVTLPLVTSTDAGLAPLSGGGTVNFLRADATWAAPANRWITVLKTADTSRASTITETDDPDLQFAVTSGQKYTVRIVVHFSTTATASQIRFRINGPTTSYFQWQYTYGRPGEGAGTDFTQQGSGGGAWPADVVSAGTASGYASIYIDCAFVATASGTFSLLWAQGASNVSPTVVRAGSVLDYIGFS